MSGKDTKGDSEQKTVMNIVSNGVHTDWQFFLRAEEAWQSMKEASQRAKEEILCEQYIISDDDVGKEFIEILIKKAKKGVNVQIIVDMVGAAVSGFFFGAALLKRMEDAGIKLSFWNPLRLWRLDTGFSLFFRNHRKLLVVDNDIGFVGGVGFRKDMREWRDTHLKVVGPVVPEMRNAFFEMWALANERKFFKRLKKRKHFTRGFQFVTNSPSVNRRFLYEIIAHEFGAAQKRIFLTTPYFIPDRKMSRRLRLAASRGVDVQILLPKVSNHIWADLAGRRSFTKLLQAGVKIYAYENHLLHAKTFAVDHHFASVGSFNFDSLSFNFNYEANVVSHNPLFVDQVAAYFEEDKKDAVLIKIEEWQHRSFEEKTLEFLATFLRKIL